MPGFEWTESKIKAADLLAARKLSFQEIANRVGVSRQWLWTWREDPDFAAKVEELTERYRQEVYWRGIAERSNRVAAQNDRWNRMQRVIEERADAPEMQEVPGGKTGLLVRRIKQIGGGESAREVEEFEVDTGLLRELREIEKQSAMELGQWDGNDLKAGEDESNPNITPLQAAAMLKAGLATVAAMNSDAKTDQP